MPVGEKRVGNRRPFWKVAAPFLVIALGIGGRLLLGWGFSQAADDAGSAVDDAVGTDFSDSPGAPPVWIPPDEQWVETTAPATGVMISVPAPPANVQSLVQQGLLTEPFIPTLFGTPVDSLGLAYGEDGAPLLDLDTVSEQLTDLDSLGFTSFRAWVYRTAELVPVFEEATAADFVDALVVAFNEEGQVVEGTEEGQRAEIEVVPGPDDSAKISFRDSVLGAHTTVMVARTNDSVVLLVAASRLGDLSETPFFDPVRFPED